MVSFSLYFVANNKSKLSIISSKLPKKIWLLLKRHHSALPMNINYDNTIANWKKNKRVQLQFAKHLTPYQ